VQQRPDFGTPPSSATRLPACFPASEAVVTGRNARLASNAEERLGQTDEPYHRLDLPLVPRRPRPGMQRRASAGGAGRIDRRAGSGAPLVPGVRAGAGLVAFDDQDRPGER
jgi:hypothetical protein